MAPNNRSHRYFKVALTYLCISGLALLNALSYQLFVFPNKFAPSGLNGLCTMIQYVLDINVGYLYLLINIPLALLIYRLVSRSIAKRSMVYVVTFSVMLLVFDGMDLSAFAYSTETGTSTILGPLVAGIISGAVYSILVQVCAYTGGTDFIASLIRRKHPELNFFWITFGLNVVVAFISYFVYGYQIEPVLLCIMYSFTSSTISDKLLKSGRRAIRFEIITEHPDELSQTIIRRLGHSATLIPAKGMYSGKQTNMLICVINRTQMSAMAAIIRQLPGTFAIMSTVTEVMGNFKNLNTEGKENNIILDTGDGPAV